MTDTNNVLGEYWADHLVDGGLCAICVNTGMFASAVTGQRMFCVCPNGRGLREQGHIPLILVELDELGGD